MSEGHPQAARYPLGHLWTEVDLARRRVNRRIADEALIMRDNLSSLFGGKKSRSAFDKTIKELTNG